MKLDNPVASALVNLDKTPFPQQPNTLELKECSICVEKFSVKDFYTLTSLLPCQHIFHANCMVNWIKNQAKAHKKRQSVPDAEKEDLRLTCPLCNL